MAIHTLYPGFIRIFYVSGGHTHKMLLPVLPVASGLTWKLTAKVSPANDWDPWTLAVSAYILKIKPFFPATTSFTAAELWTLAASDADPIFREVFSIAVVGTGAGSAVAFAQDVVTWRTAIGGLLRTYFMEDASPVNLVQNPPYPAGILLDLFNFMTGVTAFIVGRDGGMPIGSTRRVTKLNDKLRKKFLLEA